MDTAERQTLNQMVEAIKSENEVLEREFNGGRTLERRGLNSFSFIYIYCTTHCEGRPDGACPNSHHNEEVCFNVK